MAKLRISDEPHVRPIPARCKIGRAPDCEVRLADSRVSAEHALLSWRGGGWEIQDLHSRNGTYVNGRLLGPGQQAPVSTGTVIGLGRDAAQCVLTEVGPPVAYAVAVDSPHTVVEAQSMFIALPNHDAPELTIVQRRDGWWLERDDGLDRVTSGAVVSTSAATWRLYLSELVPRTRDAEDSVLTLSSVRLSFTFSRQGGPTKLQLSRNERRIEFEFRTHHAVLLALAQARLADRDRIGFEQGWRSCDALLETLGYNTNRLNVEIHRARRQFADVGVVDAARLVERRREPRTLRIGIADLAIETDDLSI
jgi:pSer/pThr/pTyr-binding forkhead associated (FHA) protein